mmetsp:Transcript_15068/g.36369  ORF Transcript_15068/g.36369 Transcript_15068/m.36369 type:complete len:83 (-) Transcript_15068:26-274(-)
MPVWGSLVRRSGGPVPLAWATPEEQAVPVAGSDSSYCADDWLVALQWTATYSWLRVWSARLYRALHICQLGGSVRGLISSAA